MVQIHSPRPNVFGFSNLRKQDECRDLLVVHQEVGLKSTRTDQRNPNYCK